MIEMKKLGMESYDAILEFDKLCFPTDCWKEEDWKDLLEDDRATYYALVEGDKIVGDLFTYNWSGENDYLKIMNIAVHPDYRKQGLAMKLMEYAKEECKESDLKKICAETRASNVAMQTVFKKCSYRLNKVEEDGYNNPVEAEFKYVYMAKIDKQITDFLIKAKQATYAGKGAETVSSREKSHDLIYEDRDYMYYDTYLGGNKFAGEEALWIKKNPYWSMNYVGRVIGENFSGDFLKEALLLVPEEKPFRGPAEHTNGDYKYECHIDGDFEWFHGKETISYKGNVIYECYFHGGLIEG